MRIKIQNRKMTVNQIGKIAKWQFAILPFAYCLFVFCQLPTANCQILPLDSILSRIERNHPALLSYENQIKSANELVNSAKMWMPPMAGMQIGENPYSFNFKNEIYNTMVFAEQWVPSRKYIKANENYLKSSSAVKQSEYEYLKNQLFSMAKEKYYERYITESKIRVLNNSLALMSKMIEISEKQMATGMGDLGSIYKLKARLADSKTMLLHEQNMVNSLTVELNYLMYAELNQQFLLDTTGLVKNYRNINLLALNDSLTLKRSDIQRMSNEISAMKLNQALMSLKSKPNYGFRFEHTSSFGEMNMGMYSAMLMLTIPTVPWSSQGYKSEAKAMGFAIDAMEQNKQAMLGMVNSTVNMLILELNTEYAEIENYSKNVIPAYQKSFDAHVLAYSQNTGDLMNVILALDDLQMVQMEYLTHLGVLLKAQADYEREMQIR